MRNRLWDQKMPTLIGIIVIAVAIWGISQFIKDSNIFKKDIPSSSVPQNIKVTDISDNSFTIAFVTEDRINSSVNYGDSNKMGYNSDSQSPTFSHRIILKNLKPKTKYFFTIDINGFSFPGSGKRYTLYTAPSINNISTEKKVISGKVIMPDGSRADNVLIYLNIDNSQTISLLTDSRGEYRITPQLRTSSLDKFFVYNQNSNISIDYMRQNLRSNVKAVYQGDIFSIPVVTLSKNYTFTSSDLDQENVSTSSGLTALLYDLKDQELKIISPLKGDSVITQTPLFKGTGPANQKISISIDSLSPNEVTSDSSGNWFYKINSALKEGQHSISMQTIDKTGASRKISQTFTIYLAQTTVTSAPIATPTIAISTPTAIPSPTSVPISQTQINQPGVIDTSIFLTILSAIFIFSGSILLAKYK